MNKICLVEWCDEPHHSKGYCSRHYSQMKLYGHILPKDHTKVTPNNIIINKEENYAELILCDKQGNEKARTKIDIEDIEKCKKYRWRLIKGYAKSSMYFDSKSKTIAIHRYIMDAPKGMDVDHINGDKLDNRKENLRICTRQQNNWNRKNVLGVKKTEYGKYHAQIIVNGEIHFLGSFETFEEAKEARLKAELEFFGEFSPNNNNGDDK